jgi:regulator of protease activity HflC (stomatin/prohibitin superfamily)
VAVPVGSADVPFIFQETTVDFQAVTIQGQVTYRVGDPKRLAALLNFTLTPNGHGYASEDPKKLPERVIHVINVLARAELQKLPLRDAIRGSDGIVEAVKKRLATAEEIPSLGLEVLGLSVLAIKPVPETARALEAEAREKLFRELDEAIYAQRGRAAGTGDQGKRVEHRNRRGEQETPDPRDTDGCGTGSPGKAAPGREGSTRRRHRNGR